MSVAMIASIIFFVALWLVSGEWDGALALSIGPIALYTFFLVQGKVNSEIGGSLEQPACKWLQVLFAAAICGMFYTFGVILCLAIVYFVVLQRDEMSLVLIPIAAAHFVPHLILVCRQKFVARNRGR
ncbi:hypothetical protein [Halomonas sp. BC04]|uniref:hypothetical protein n=1 Tax=Halomonas sp. BC04 TaxID=1403540 RepID=UPI0003ED81F4|nr:hypothetical protein [Halomonas sp. BC04]EWH01488.1 hypothetical protein Q427_13775 [Halomonas sp. BC04]